MQDLISRKWLMECVDEGWIKFETEKDENLFIHLVRDIAPSAQPYTDEEIQKIQDLEQAQFDKIHDLAYQEGKADAMAEIIRCRDCRYWQDNNGGYPHDECRWNKDETPNEDDYCSYAERREVSE